MGHSACDVNSLFHSFVTKTTSFIQGAMTWTLEIRRSKHQDKSTSDGGKQAVDRERNLCTRISLCISSPGALHRDPEYIEVTDV